MVEPKIVLEVAFNNMMQSDRHDSGYALRFPRIVRLRPDKSADEADTIERVKEIYRKTGIVLRGLAFSGCGDGGAPDSRSPE